MLSPSRDEFDRLLRQALPQAGRLAIRLTGDPDTAEDLVGEAMLRALRRRDSFRGESAFTTWLFAIVINTFRDGLRARRGGRVLHLGDAPDPAASCGDQLAAAELATQIASCVSSLPPRQREVVVLTVYEQMTAEQAAAVLQTTAGNVRVLLHHARGKLREQLASCLPEEARHDRPTPA